MKNLLIIYESNTSCGRCDSYVLCLAISYRARIDNMIAESGEKQGRFSGVGLVAKPWEIAKW